MFVSRYAWGGGSQPRVSLWVELDERLYRECVWHDNMDMAAFSAFEMSKDHYFHQNVRSKPVAGLGTWVGA